MELGAKKARREVKQKLLKDLAVDFPTSTSAQIRKLAQQVVSGRVKWPDALAAVSGPEADPNLTAVIDYDPTLGN